MYYLLKKVIHLRDKVFIVQNEMMKYQMIIMNIDVIVLMKLMNFEFNYFVS
jgi:hypothetical protein